MRGTKPCPTPGCPTLIPRDARRCPPCASRHEARRGTRQERGYDAQHDRARADAEPTVIGKLCARHTLGQCVMPQPMILPGQAWDLDHRDDRNGYIGPSHRKCNRAAR